MVRFPRHSLLVLLIVSCGPNGNIDGGSAIGKKTDGDQRGTSDQTATPTSTPKSTSETSFDLTGCGYSLSPPTAVLNSQQLTMVPATVSTTIQVILFQSKKDVAITGNFVMESSLSHQAISYKATPASNADAPEVTSFVTGATGSGDATLIDLDQRAKIGSSPDWAGLFCVLQPATKIQHNAAQNVTAEFSQPIPYGLLVNGDTTRLKAELASKRTWSNVVAKITDSSNPSAPVGSAMTGNVTMEPISSSGNGDVAVKITYNFGNADKNQLLGLPSNIVWYIDSAAHKIKAVQVDVVGGKPNLFK